MASDFVATNKCKFLLIEYLYIYEYQIKEFNEYFPPFIQVLAGHEGPVSCLSFSPSAAILASASWDKSVRLWDVFEGKGSKESIQLLHDGKLFDKLFAINLW